MQLIISNQKAAPIQEGMIGLFFEDINYAADGGLYAEMLENRSFEFVDCSGTVGDYYTVQDCGYGWYPTEDCGVAKMEYVMGSPVHRNNPHYLRVTADTAGQGFWNKAYDGVYLEKDKQYKVSFYARMVDYQSDLTISVRKKDMNDKTAVACDGCGKAVSDTDVQSITVAHTKVKCIHAPKGAWQKWQKYEVLLTAAETVKGGQFTITLNQPGIVEFDFISMMPCDAVAGVFRKDLFELLKGLHPGFLRFPGGCIIEGNTLENRYRWKESVGSPESRKANFNRWAVHGTTEENGWHTEYSHYNQTLGLGYYEYFLLCEMIGAKAIPVMNVGLACQYQSYELVEMDEPEFQEFIQDALDLIEFANGAVDTKWGGLRAQMGHPESFGLTMLGIGNEQWQTDKVDFFARYQAFEEAIHAKYPEIKLIGSAGPDITSERYDMAWAFYKENCPKKENFCYAVDEHYYVKPDWFYEHVDFYDEYPRDVKVFSGEYAAHPTSGMNKPEANTLGGALAEAAFLTGVERNADVVVLASYAPLFARVGYAQWSPDMIWFDEKCAYGTPSYYVQKLYGENMGNVTLEYSVNVDKISENREKCGQTDDANTIAENSEKSVGATSAKAAAGFLRRQQIYLSVSLDEIADEIIIKAVNKKDVPQKLELATDGSYEFGTIMQVYTMSGADEEYNTVDVPDKVGVCAEQRDFTGCLELAGNSFTVTRIPRSIRRE